MLRSTTRWLQAIMLLCAILATSFTGVSSATAAAGNPAHCDAGIARIDNQSFGQKVPVIFVHGFKGTPSDWGSIQSNTGFVRTINDIPNVAVAHSFQYTSMFWVDHQDNGPKLAKTIDCISRISLQNGGKGKVIIVSYSMGGLVTRDALGRRSTDNTRAIADEVGQAITIGTPHGGTTIGYANAFFGPRILASAFVTGSPELERLPHFPGQTIVHTIAGNTVRVYYGKTGAVDKREELFDDMLVTTNSAHYEYTVGESRGGGSHTVHCEKQYFARSFFGGYNEGREKAFCEHTQLISNPNNGVREDTASAIKKFLAPPPPPFSTTNLTIGSLTTRYDSRWSNVEYGADGPGMDGGATDTTNGVPCTNCTTLPNPTSYASVQIFDYGQWCSDTVQQCALGSLGESSEIIGDATNVTIGGRAPDYSARYLEYGRTEGNSFVWCLSDQKICIHYRRAADTPRLELSQALLDLFSNATWSN